MCQHNHKTCKQLKWGTSENTLRVNREIVSKSSSNVDLWYCSDCDRELMYDWHIGRYVPLQLSEQDGYLVYKVK